jgi:hypothetical protein
MRTLPKRSAACYNFPDWKFEWENRRISTQHVFFVVYNEVKTTKNLVLMGLYIYIPRYSFSGDIYIYSSSKWI